MLACILIMGILLSVPTTAKAEYLQDGIAIAKAAEPCAIQEMPEALLDTEYAPNNNRGQAPTKTAKNLTKTELLFEMESLLKAALLKGETKISVAGYQISKR